MSKIIRFKFDKITKEFYTHTGKRKSITKNGCNEPFKNRFFCPKREFFTKEKCPFENLTECYNFLKMCGRI